MCKYNSVQNLAPCTNGQLFLADGNVPNEGRVELCINSEWATVCRGTSWSNADTAVICNGLGYEAENI